MLNMILNKKGSSSFAKKLNSTVLFYSIYITQFATAIIIYKLRLITDFYLSWILVYYILSFVCSLPQAGFSDVYGRKRHLLISSAFVLFSVLYLFLMYIIGFYQPQLRSFGWSFASAGVACFLLGSLGNFIPIARGGISDIKIHDFRTAIGLSTTLIGLGWITAVGLELILPEWGILTAAAVLQATTILALKYLFYDPEDSSISKIESSSSSFDTTINSYRWFGKMFLVAGGASALLAYFFSESTFYPIYSLKEEGETTFGNMLVGATMAFGYGTGVFSLWLFRCSDRASIKFGVLISLISILSQSMYKFFFENELSYADSQLVTEGILDFFTAFGFGLFVPSLFAVMASNIDAHHAGRLFGAVDTTDTLALSLSSGILWLKQRLKIKEAIVYTLFSLLFLISCFFYKRFVKRFSTYEKSKQRKNIRDSNR